MKHYRTIIAAGLLIFGSLLFGLRVIWGNAWQHITVAPEITRITTPLHADGTVDYIAALNEHASQGVTNENNAAIPILRINSRDSFPPGSLKKIADLLHCPDLLNPGEGAHCFTNNSAFREQRLGYRATDDQLANWRDELRSAKTSPWKAEDHAELAAWLDANNVPLELLKQAVARPRYFIPLYKPAENSFFSELAVVPLWLNSGFADALAARAMLKISMGNLSGAYDDAMTLMHLAYLMGQQTTVMGRLVGFVMTSSSLDIDAAVLSAGPSLAQVAHMRDDLSTLPTLPSLMECVDQYERFACLDALTLICRFGADGVGRTAPPSPPKTPGSFSFGILPVHFDTALRDANSRYDRVVTTASIPDFKTREMVMENLNADNLASLASLAHAGSQNALMRLAVPQTDYYSFLLRIHENTEQQFNLLLSGLEALTQFSGKPVDETLLQKWATTQPPNLFLKTPIESHVKGRHIILFCQGPDPLPPDPSPLFMSSMPSKPAPRHDFTLQFPLP